MRYLSRARNCSQSTNGVAWQGTILATLLSRRPAGLRLRTPSPRLSGARRALWRRTSSLRTRSGHFIKKGCDPLQWDCNCRKRLLRNRREIKRRHEQNGKLRAKGLKDAGRSKNLREGEVGAGEYRRRRGWQIDSGAGLALVSACEADCQNGMVRGAPFPVSGLWSRARHHGGWRRV